MAIQMQRAISSSHLSFGAASCGFLQHADSDQTRPTTTCSECFGPLLPLHETHNDVTPDQTANTVAKCLW